jgi:hypothetical protein
MVREAMRTLCDRLQQCRRDSGKHLSDVLFRSKICNGSGLVYLNGILFPIVLYKNKHLIRISTFSFNFEIRQFPVTHPVKLQALRLVLGHPVPLRDISDKTLSHSA